MKSRLLPSARMPNEMRNPPNPLCARERSPLKTLFEPRGLFDFSMVCSLAKAAGCLAFPAAAAAAAAAHVCSSATLPTALLGSRGGLRNASSASCISLRALHKQDLGGQGLSSLGCSGCWQQGACRARGVASGQEVGWGPAGMLVGGACPTTCGRNSCFCARVPFIWMGL